MEVILFYISYIVPICAIVFFLYKCPVHFYIRKGLIYTVLAFFWFFFEQVINDLELFFNFEKSEFPGLVSSPISTVYHLYFFLLLTSDTFSHKWFGKVLIKALILFSLLIFVIIDYYFKTVVYSYIYTNVVVIIFSIVYFKFILKNDFEKVELRPGAYIIIGYFIFSICLIPLSLVVKYVTNGIVKPTRLVGFYSFLFKITILTPQVIFYTLLCYGCYRYWLEYRKAQ